MNDPKIVNLQDLPWTPWSSGDGISVEIRDPARKLGSSHCGFRLHRHRLQEEMFLILSGSGTLRHGERRVPVKAGDPAAQTFVNTGSEPLAYAATGDRPAREAWFKAGR